MKIGLCFPGGGAKGARQAGAFRATYEWFRKRGTEPHACAGASVGTLNMLLGIQAFVDEGHSLAQLEHLWCSVRRSDVCGWMPRLHPWSNGIYSTKGLRDSIDTYVRPTKLRRSSIKFDVRASAWGGVADPVAKPRDKHFKSTVLASASYPVVFPPVDIDGVYASDRGIKRNVPVSDLIKHDCETIVVLRTSATSEAAKRWEENRCPRWHEQLGMLAGELMETQTEWQIAEVKRINAEIRNGNGEGKRAINLIQIDPPIEPNIGVLEFDAKKASRAYWASYESAKVQLDALTRLYD